MIDWLVRKFFCACAYAEWLARFADMKACEEGLTQARLRVDTTKPDTVAQLMIEEQRLEAARRREAEAWKIVKFYRDVEILG